MLLDLKSIRTAARGLVAVDALLVDIRSVYATVLQNWLGAEPSAILGQPFPVVDFV